MDVTDQSDHVLMNLQGFDESEVDVINKFKYVHVYYEGLDNCEMNVTCNSDYFQVNSNILHKKLSGYH